MILLLRSRETQYDEHPRPERSAPSAPARSQPGGGYLGDHAMGQIKQQGFLNTKGE